MSCFSLVRLLRCAPSLGLAMLGCANGDASRERASATTGDRPVGSAGPAAIESPSSTMGSAPIDDDAHEAGLPASTAGSSSDAVAPDPDGRGDASSGAETSDASDSMAPPSAPNTSDDDPVVMENLERMQDELVACGLWEKGELSPTFSTTIEGRCFASCFAQYVDCDAASDYACQNNPPLADPESELAVCIRGCQYFTCTDGTRLFLFNRCDGGEDCADGSDELDCPPLELFTCNMGNEIPAAWRCNAEIDCGQGEDEENCEDEYFVCGTGENYPSEWECDLRQDCPDGSDEGPHCARLICE